jgi:hypothetical protein
LTSRRQSRARPIEFVQLRISFKADRPNSAKIKQAVPGVVLRPGGCEVKVEGENPGEVADRAREILEKLRSIADAPKGFK